MNFFHITLTCVALITQLTTACIAQEATISAPAPTVEQDEYIQSFIKTLPPKAASLVSYKYGKLTIKSIPEDSSSFYTGIALTAIGSIFALLSLPAIALTSCKNEQAIVAFIFVIGLLLAIIGGWGTCVSIPPDEWFLVFDANTISLNGTAQIKWSQMTNMLVETTKTYNRIWGISETKILRIFDRFQNQLLTIPNCNSLVISFENMVAIVKHYWEDANQKQLTIPEKETAFSYRN